MTGMQKVVLALAGLTMTACDSPSAPRVQPAAVTAVSVDTTAGPIFRTATIRLSRAAGIEVTYGAAGTPVLTIASEATDSVHVVQLPRLRASRDYTLEVAVAGGSSTPTRTTFRTGALPAAVAAMQFEVTGTPTLPVALLDVALSSAFYGLLMVEDGEVVGYLPSNGSLFGSTRRANGDIVLLDINLGLVSRRLDGTIVHRLPQPDSAPGAPYGRIHHDVTATPHNTLLFIANETKLVGSESVVGEALWEWSPESGTVVKRWSAFDHLDWATERGARSTAGNWLHGNAISYGSRGNVLMSLRNADQVLSIAPDFRTVEWKLGGDNPTLTVADNQRFYGQHAVSETAPNRLLVYDNGADRPGGLYTRVVEFDINTTARVATPVWEFRPQPSIYAPLVGSARRLPNGNTVIVFGMIPTVIAGATGPLIAVEVDGNGVERWRLTPSAELGRLYRLNPVASLLGERPGAFR